MTATTIAKDRIIGYTAACPDGRFGRIAEETLDVADDFLVVEKGRWMFRTTYTVPLDLVRGVSHEHESVSLNLSTEHLARMESTPRVEADPVSKGMDIVSP